MPSRGCSIDRVSRNERQAEGADCSTRVGRRDELAGAHRILCHARRRSFGRNRSRRIEPLELRSARCAHGLTACQRRLSIPMMPRHCLPCFASTRRTSLRWLAISGSFRRRSSLPIAAACSTCTQVHSQTSAGAGCTARGSTAAVIEAGRTETAVTVHLVDEDYDRGAVLARWPVAVKDGDDATTLAARVLSVEHIVYPRIVDALAAMIVAERHNSHQTL